MSTVAEVRLWGTTIGVVSVERPGGVATFQYTPKFVRSGIEVSPLVMPLSDQVYSFGQLAVGTFHGLPGLLADSLPDRFGNAVIDAWLAAQGRAAGEIDAVERLCYTGTRGMGALEFRPVMGPRSSASRPVAVEALVALAAEVLQRREALTASFADAARERALRDILRVGASAGGARPKAVIAWNPATNEVRSGQVTAPPGFEYWLLKFDGVDGAAGADLFRSSGFGAIEYAYSLMARAAGIRMSECRLFKENGRSHFMTRRFDRQPDGGKLHMQSLGALAHLDFNQPGVHGYEQAMLIMRRLGLGSDEVAEQFRRMVFNVVARNQDDHVKNIAFLMDRLGRWSLAPAYDLNFSYNPAGTWTARHQMSLANKLDGFVPADLRAVGDAVGLAAPAVRRIVHDVTAAVRRWPEWADLGGVDHERVGVIGSLHRLNLATD